MPRIAVDIKWNGSSFSAFNKDGSPIPTYSNLVYGAIDNKIDDALESIKGFTLASRTLALKVTDINIVMQGFCDVP